MYLHGEHCNKNSQCRLIQSIPKKKSTKTIGCRVFLYIVAEIQHNEIDSNSLQKRTGMMRGTLYTWFIL